MLPHLVLSLFASSLYCAHASLHSSIPEDIYAFPKYRVSFLNALPVSNHTAQHWLHHGLQGGEPEFLGQWFPDSIKEIGSATAQMDPPSPSPPLPSSEDPIVSPVLEHMRLGPSKSYMCLIPPAPTLPPPPPDDPSTPLTPSHSWSLLQPLSGTCLYHRQGWFTYSYCHNVHVRQFKELPATFPHPPGPRVVEEDPEWESYTLGRSSLGAGEANDEVGLAKHNLELARQPAGQRYLVQRWSDGTICDKSGRPREIEVQFHCSMTMTDTIMFVKETRTCEYVLVVHTPRLCGEPGFKSRLEQMPETALRCREVLPVSSQHSDADADTSVGGDAPGDVEAQHPLPHTRRRRPIPAPPPAPAPAPTPASADGTEKPDGADTARTRMIRRALEALVGGRGEDMPVFEFVPGNEEGEFFISFGVDEPGEGAGAGAGEGGAEGGGLGLGRGGTLEDVLRAAGYEVRGQKTKAGEGGGDEDGDGDGEDKDGVLGQQQRARDEL